MTAKRIRQVYGIVLSIALIAAGLCLMWACWQVYTSGPEHPYNAQSIAKAFAPISIVVYIALGLTLGSILLHIFLPQEKEKRKVEKNYSLMLQKLHEKNDLNGCGDEKLVAAIGKEQKKRILHSCITLLLLAVGFVVVLCYSLNMKNVYSGDAHASTDKIKLTAAVMLCCFAIPFGYGIWTAYYQKASIRRELELMKMVASPRKDPLPAPKAQPKWMAYIPYVGLAAAIALIVVGYLGDGHMGVLTKAIEICKECVGIG